MSYVYLPVLVVLKYNCSFLCIAIKNNNFILISKVLTL